MTIQSHRLRRTSATDGKIRVESKCVSLTIAIITICGLLKFAQRNNFVAVAASFNTNIWSLGRSRIVRGSYSSLQKFPPLEFQRSKSSSARSFAAAAKSEASGKSSRIGESEAANRRHWIGRRVIGRVTNTRTTTTSSSVMTSSASPSQEGPGNKLRFVDIGANLLDERFTKGMYNGKVRHEPDWDQVMERAVQVGVTHIVLTAGTLRESRRALSLVRELRHKQQERQPQEAPALHFGCTIGVHPTRCSQEFVNFGDLQGDDSEPNDESSNDNKASISSAKDVLDGLLQLAVDGQGDRSVVAIGEIGLDYDRLEFCPKDVQQEYLMLQLATFDSDPKLHKLPLFLHNRNVNDDLLHMLTKQQQQTSRRYTGVVHSFDDSLELAQRFIDMGFFIGLNGCSLKTTENLQVIKDLPLDKILLETDCPYCEIKNTHAGISHVSTKFDKKADKKFELGKMVKGRNEPCQIIQVAEVIAGVKGISVQEVADVCYQNSLELYGWQAVNV